MSDKYTQGPWAIGATGNGKMRIWEDNQFLIADCNVSDYLRTEAKKENASRIVACVNACEGIQTEVLENEAGNIVRVAGDLMKQRDERIAELERDVENYHSTMGAAAIEIDEHWTAHCDAEGYGPVNLMHRLEKGFPSEYGYQPRKWEELQRDAARYRWLKSRFTGYDFNWMGEARSIIAFEVDDDFRGGKDIEAAINAAMQASQP